MKKFRFFTILVSVINIIGELYRSNIGFGGDGRHIVWVLDDVISGVILIIAALAFTQDTPARRAFFAGAWGIGLGMIYPSFFASLHGGANFNSGNLDWQFLLGVKGFIFALCCSAVILAIRLPYGEEA